MKRNKFIYMLIFSLVFLGFTSGVKAGCCYKENGIWKFSDASVNDGNECSRLHPGSPIEIKSDSASCVDRDYVCCMGGVANNTPKAACGSKNWILKDSCKAVQTVTTDTCVYDPELATEAQCNSHSAQGYGWDSSKQCCRLRTNTEAPTEQNYTAPTPSTTSEKTDCNIQKSECDKLNNSKYDETTRCCTWAVNNNDNNNNNNNSDPDNNSAGDGSTTATSGTTGSDTMTIGFNCDDSNVQSLIRTIKTIYNLLKYATPIILIIMGSIDFAKAVVAGKEDEIEKNKKRFMNRLFIAVLIFLLLSIFQLVTNIISNSGAANSNSWIDCWNK